MNRSTRLKDILNNRTDLWNESDSDTSSTDQNEKSLNNSDISSDENSSLPPRRSCCLICSILPNLSNVNTCQKHLASLIAPIPPPPQVVYMMPPPIENCSKSHCHCRMKSKRRHRSSSSSSSSSSSTESKRHRRKRSMIVLSSDNSSQDDVFFSPNAPSQSVTTTNQQHQSSQGRLSPSLPPSTNINSRMNTSLQKCQQLALTSFLQRTHQRNNDEIEPILKDTQVLEGNSSDVIEITSDSAYSPSISNRPIVHVKDDDEICNDTDEKPISINMTQMTEEMRNHEFPQPKIYLKRISLNEIISIYDQN